MKKKTLFHALCAIAVTFWSVGVAAAALPSLFEKQFARLDSSLTRIAGLPEVRMKEVAPFDELAKQVLAAHPEIAMLIRTNSKGIVVNCARRANGESLLRADVSKREWYAAAKSGMNTFRGPLRKENGRTRRILSRPLSINTAAGASRFGGVVAMFLDMGEKQTADGAALVKKAPEPPGPSPQSPAGPANFDKQELLPYGDTAVTSRPQSAGGETAFLRIAGAIAVILVAFCLWLIISTLCKRKPPKPSTSPGIEQQLVPPSDEDVQGLPTDSTGSDEEKPAEIRPPYADIPSFLPPQQNEPAPVTFNEPVVEQVTAPSFMQHEPLEKTTSGGEKIHNNDVLQVHDEIVAEMRAKITDEKRDKIYKEELEKLVSEIRQRLIDTEMAGLVEALRKQFAEELYEEVSRLQRDAIREAAIREITEEEHQRIESGLRKTILDNEKNRIIAEEAPDMRRQIRTQMHGEELENIHREVRDEIYSETVQAIKRNLEGEYRSVVEDKIAELNVHLQKKVKSDIRAAMKADYDRLVEHIEQLSASLTNIEALQSLSQTITMLTDEKKKYKYLNLNTAQTESLLEYLKRVHNRFNIFFDKVDESVRELMLNLGRVTNKLDSNE